MPVAQLWWESLGESDRDRIAGLWDERLEVSFFAPQADATGQVDGWEEVPAVEGGRFVPHDDSGVGEWGPGYFEHLLQHPELVLAYEAPTRTFHIGCTRHPVARACLAGGAVPADFVCPAGSGACPLERLRGAQLSVARRA
ncbi:MAG: hypothetical protein U0804_18470 [Gemmataceae bacterium]